MVQFIARYDGTSLRPEGPVDLPTDTPLRVIVEDLPAAPAPADQGNPAEWLDRMEAELGLLDGPEDWAAELDHYLYGTPKRDGGHAG